MSQTFSSIRPDELDRYRQAEPRPQLVDCRSAGEFAAGHVPGSVNIPVEELEARSHDLDPERPVVFICRSGQRAVTAARLLARGAPVAVLDGGITAWQRSGHEVIVNAPSTWSLERQVRLIAGSTAALGGVGSFLDPRWAAVPLVVGLGLAFAAITNSCAVGGLLMRMPWNRRHA
jgi:rhodanese-related sulfurtransferase